MWRPVFVRTSEDTYARTKREAQVPRSPGTLAGSARLAVPPGVPVASRAVPTRARRTARPPVSRADARGSSIRTDPRYRAKGAALRLRHGRSIVASAWGTHADWYRNVQAHPALAVRTAGAWYVPDARTVPPDEAFAVFTDWTRRQHWFATVMLAQIGLSWDVSQAEQRAIVAGLQFMGFRPAERPGGGL